MRMKTLLSLLLLIFTSFCYTLIYQLASEIKRDTTVISNYNLVKVKLAEIKFNKKAISSFSYGKATFSPT